MQKSTFYRKGYSDFSKGRSAVVHPPPVALGEKANTRLQAARTSSEAQRGLLRRLSRYHLQVVLRAVTGKGQCHGDASLRRRYRGICILYCLPQPAQ